MTISLVSYTTDRNHRAVVRWRALTAYNLQCETICYRANRYCKENKREKGANKGRVIRTSII